MTVAECALCGWGDGLCHRCASTLSQRLRGHDAQPRKGELGEWARQIRLGWTMLRGDLRCSRCRLRAVLATEDAIPLCEYDARSLSLSIAAAALRKKEDAA